MAKEKAEKVFATPLEAIEDNLKNKFGSDIIIGGDKLLDEPQQIIPVSPKLDLIIGGGIPEGSWVTLTGKPKVGKTSLALHIAAKCQSEEFGGRHVYYLDIEGRLKKMNIQGIDKLDMTKFHRIRSKQKKILSAQEYLQAGEDILKSHPKCVLIIDSYSALCHEKELIEGVGTSTRGAGAYSLLAGFCRQMSNVVPVMNSIVIGITHLMANVSGYGAALMEKGGNAIGYQGDIKLRAKSVELWRPDGEKTRPIGQKVLWSCEWSALGGPGGEIEGYIRYGKGIDEVYETIDNAIDLGIIEKGGAWFYLNFLPDSPKFQGQDKLYKGLVANPEWLKIINHKMKGITLES